MDLLAKLSTGIAGDKLKRWEGWVLVASLGAYFLLNFVTGERCPLVTFDEVLWTDPGANLFFGRGFTSSVWYTHPATSFWAGNVPLHPLLLYSWLRVFGFSISSVRALGYILTAAAMLLLWVALRRLRWITDPFWRLATVALISCGYGVAYGYRMGRPDPLTIFLVCASILMFSVESRSVRFGGLILVGIFFPWAGLQLAVYAPILLALVVIFTRARFLPESECILAGEAAGAGLLLSLYAAKGVLHDFVGSALGFHTSLGRMTVLYKLQDAKMNFGGFLKDPSFLILLILAFALARASRMSRDSRQESILRFALCASLLIPVAVFALGIYPIYYSWMAYLPLAICVCAVLGQGDCPVRTGRGRRLVTATILLAIVAGLPAYSFLAVAGWAERDPMKVERLATEALKRKDSALIHYSAYYGVKQHVAGVYLDSCLPWMTADEKASITVLVIRPEDLSEDVRQLGGSWIAVGHEVRSLEGSGLYGMAHTKVLELYNLSVYRRAEDGGATQMRTKSA